MTGSRIVVTGMGVITANAKDRNQFWQALQKGQSGISSVESFETGSFISSQAGEVKEFEPAEDLKHMGRAKQFAISTAREALAQAKLRLETYNPRFGVALGTTMGESKELEKNSDQLSSTQLDSDFIHRFNQYLPQTISHELARVLGFGGPCLMLPNACAAANFAISYSVEQLLEHKVDVMLAGGSDAFSRYAYSGFSRLGAIAPDCPRPFSRGRQGMVPGEGAAVLVLERYEYAKARGANILAEICGCGESCDASHITQPDAVGIASAMQRALSAANLRSEQISFVSVHGTGTPANDVTESKALRLVFGENPPPVTATKSMTGHAMGAASAIECVACILALQHNFLPPTINYLGPDPECAVDNVPNTGRHMELEYALKTASAFGGNNAVLIFKKAELGVEQ